jgi:uncharacterized protein (DUF1697 family)
VGGNNIIKMADLKTAVEKGGFKAVKTYIQSGNLIFESDQSEQELITGRLEKILLEAFKYEACIIVKSAEQLKRIVAEVPAVWLTENDRRKYVAFIRESLPVSAVLPKVELNEGIDLIDPGQGVLYLSTLTSGLTRSRFTRLISKKIYLDITIRNFETTLKILELMES